MEKLKNATKRNQESVETKKCSENEAKKEGEKKEIK